MSRRVRWSGPAAVTACALVAWLIGWAPGVAATHRGDGVVDEVALQMTYQQPAVAGGRGHLLAQANADDGSPVVGVEVEFLRDIAFLGSRVVSIGSAVTDSSGLARVTLDTHEPMLVVRARFKGNELYLPAEVTSEIHQPVAPDGAAPGGGGGGKEPGLAIVAAIMPPILAALALAIWLALLGLVAATVLGIERNRGGLTAPRQGRNRQ